MEIVIFKETYNILYHIASTIFQNQNKQMILVYDLNVNLLAYIDCPYFKFKGKNLYREVRYK